MTTATATCYRQVDGFIQAESGWVICPKSYGGLCCQTGGDCLDEQICHNPKASTPNGSGYYIGLCTDATYKSPSCSSRCTDDNWGDVTYNSSTNLWACCGTNESCDNPTNETFLAPSPQQLLAAASSQSAITVASTSHSQSATTTASTSDSQSATAAASTSHSSATVTVTSSPSTTAHQTSSLSEGAKAGIGVGATIAAVAIIALLAWIVMLRKGSKSHGQPLDSVVVGRRDGGMMNEGLPKEAQRDDGIHEHELSGYGRRHEMEGGRIQHSL